MRKIEKWCWVVWRQARLLFVEMNGIISVEKNCIFTVEGIAFFPQVEKISLGQMSPGMVEVSHRAIFSIKKASFPRYG